MSGSTGSIRAGRNPAAAWGGLRRRTKRLAFGMALAATLLPGIIVLSAPTANAAGIVTASIDVVSTGTGFGTADQCSLPEETSATDAVVCSNDAVGYQWNYNVTGSPSEATTVTFSQTVPAGMSFEQSNLTVCQGSPGTFSGTGTITVNPDGSETLTCVITFPAGGSLSGNIPISTYVSGDVPNGTILEPPLTLTQGQLDEVDVPTPVEVVSEPRVDLVKRMDLLQSGPNLYNGQDGYFVFVSQGMMVNPGPSKKGQEALATPFTWTDDLSGVPADSELVFVTSAGYSTATNSNTNCHSGAIYGFPYTYNSNGSNLECQQTGGAGAPITFTLHDANLSGEPTNPPYAGDNGSVIWSGGFILFIPRGSVPEGDAGTVYSNQLTGFDPTSVSGQSNYEDGYEFGGEPGDTCTDPTNNNNCAGVLLINGAPGPGQFGKGIVRDGGCTAFVDPGQSGNDTGVAQPDFCHTGGAAGQPSQVVTPQEPLYDWIDITTGNAFAPYVNMTVCDKWDPSEQQYDPSRQTIFRNVSGATPYAQAQIVVQYTTADYTAQAARDAGGCGLPGDDVLDGPWYDTVADVPGGAAAISGVRVINTDPAGVYPGSRVIVYVPLINVHDVTAQPLVDVASWTYTGSPAVSPDNQSGTMYGGAAAYVVVRTTTAITKDTVPTMTTVGAGNTINFRLQPSLTSGDPAALPEVVTVVDTLPSCALNPQPTPATAASWSVVVTPADPGPDGIACTADDVSGAVQTFTSTTPIAPNTTLTPIDYTVVLSPVTPDNTSITNTAVVSSPGSVDLPVGFRTAAKSLLVRAAAQITIIKAVDQPVVEINPDTIGWTVTVSNTSTLEAGSTTWIDVLPWDGDARGTAMNGTLGLTDVSALTPDVTLLEFTSAASASIVDDPTDPSNEPAGATVWCLEAAFGTPGCPANWSAVTAFRMTVADFGPGVVTGVKIDAAPQGNVEGNVYVNQVGPGDASSLAEPLPESNPAQVAIVASDIGDTVWLDTNRDGIFDPGESGIAGVTVVLFDDNGVQIATTTTDAAGVYAFPGYHSGDYRVAVVTASLPAGLLATYDLDGGTATPDSDSGLFTLGINLERLDVDFGYVPLIVLELVTMVATGEEAVGYVGPETAPSVSPHAPVVPGTTIVDNVWITATESPFPTLTIDWTLYGPVAAVDGTCTGVNWAGAPVHASGSYPATAAGRYVVASATPAATGCYTYAHESDGVAQLVAPFSLAAGDPAETVLVQEIVPEPTTTTIVPPPSTPAPSIVPPTPPETAPTTPVTVPPDELPTTGGNTSGLILLAGSALLVGVFMLVVRRRTPQRR